MTTNCKSPLSSTMSQSLLKFMCIKLVMLFNHHILCHHPLLLLPSVFPRIRVFSNELPLHTSWSKYWSLSFSISPSSEYSGLISFKIDWFDLLAVQGTLKFSPTPQFESINSMLSFLYGSAHDSTQHLYMTNRKTIALLHGPLSDRGGWQVTVHRVTKTWTQLKWHGTHAPLSGKWCLCFLIHCLGLSQLFFQGASVF